MLLGRLLFVVSILSFLTGCFYNPKSDSFENFNLPILTKDELARVDGRSFTVADFLTIRSALQRPSSDLAFWVGISSIAIQNKATQQGRSIRGKTALDLARYAIGDLPQLTATESLKEYFQSGLDSPEQLPSPQEVKSYIESITHNSIVERNPIPISEYH